jgi:hypothetical protein
MASGSWPVVGKCGLGKTIWLERTNAEANLAKEETSRYRRGWDADAKADWPDTAADTPGSATSTRLIVRGADANWDCGAASVADDISFDYSQKISAA